MKTKLLTIAMTLLTHAVAHAAFISNVYTTNSGASADQHVTNIVQGAAVTVLNPTTLAAGGGVTTNNVGTWADLKGAASTAQASAVSISQAYTDDILTQNPFSWISIPATNHITRFDTNVVTSVIASTGITISTSLDSLGYHVTISATGTNQVSVTNLNAVILALAGGLTTNNFATYCDTLGLAKAATNGYPWGSLYDAAGRATQTTNGYVWGSLYDAAGAALGSTNLGNIRFTNTALLGSIITASNIVLSFTTNSSGVVVATISGTGGGGVFQPAATNLYGWAGVPTNNYVQSTNLVGQMIGGTNINLAATTNAGLVSVTINYTGTTIPQLGSQNLTNWSTIGTNIIVLTTNVVTKITAGTGVTVTAVTNAGGINYTVNQTTSPAVVRAGSFTAVAGGSGSVVFSSTMGSTPVVTMGPTDWGNSATGRSFVIITAVSATGFSWSDANDTSGVNKTIYYIATLPQ